MIFDFDAFLIEAKQRADEAVRQRRRQAKYNDFMQSEDWQSIRRVKMNIAGHRCEKCGAKEELQVHHLNYDRFGGNELFTDLQVLCKPCHERSHGRTF